jgi:hypothetical protein
MTTILLALGDRALREACDAHLRATGLLPLQLQRPLEIVDLRTKLACDLVCLDETQLVIDTLTVVRGGLAGPLPVVGIGVDAPGVAASLALPLQLQSLTAAIAALTTPFVRAMEPAAATGQELPRLTFDPVRRTVSARGQSVSLTRTEYRLLEYLQAETDRDVTIEELLDGVWGTSEGIGTAALIRSHIRNLRLKLSRLGVGDVIRVRRGHGYAYVG